MIKKDRFLRIKDIIGDPQSSPPVHPIIPVCKSTWWAGVKSGRYPKPVKLGPRITAWRESDVYSIGEQRERTHD